MKSERFHHYSLFTSLLPFPTRTRHTPTVPTLFTLHFSLFTFTVGYQNKDLSGVTEEAPLGGGFQMLSGSFLGIGEGGCWLSSLIPQGYEDNEDMEEETRGDFNIQVLSKGGQVDATYRWTRSKNDGEWQNDGHWTTPAGNVQWNAGTGKFDNDVEFKAGEGFYFRSPDHSGDEDTPYTMTLIYPFAK